MEQPTHGRHRRAPARRTLPLAGVVVAAVLLVVAASGATVLLTGGFDDGTASPPPPAPSATSSPTAGPAPVLLTGTRTVRARAGVVTVLETVTVAEGDAVSVGPATRSSEPALELTGVQVLAEDGTATTFTEAVTLSVERMLTVRATYRLRSCPDLLPVSWPSPMQVSGDWSRTWTRTSEPLRTAQTLCPNAPARARPLPGLTARVSADAAPGQPPEVRVVLRWRGDTRLTVVRVGSLGGLAAEAPVVRGGACDASGCVLAIDPRATSPLRVQPVESCPNARPRSDRMTVLARTDGRAKPARPVSVAVAGLGRWLDRNVCR